MESAVDILERINRLSAPLGNRRYKPMKAASKGQIKEKVVKGNREQHFMRIKKGELKEYNPE